MTREVSRRWTRTADPVLVGWRADLTAMRLLSPDEQHRALHGGPAVDTPEVDTVVVPWRCTYILPELAAEVAPRRPGAGHGRVLRARRST